MSEQICTARQIVEALDNSNAERLRALPNGSEILNGLLAEATSRWGALQLPSQEVARHLAARLPPAGESFDRALANWHVSDLCLSCGCANGNERAVKEFYREYAPLMRSLLAKMNLTAPLSDDIQQSLLDQLLVGAGGASPMLARYAGVGRLSSWLRVVVTRTARRSLQREKILVPMDDDRLAVQLIEQSGNAELDQAKVGYRDAFKGAFKQALRTLSPRETAILRHRFVDGLKLQHIGAIYRVHHSTVHRWLDSIRETLIGRTQRILATELKLGDAECESIIRLIQSDFDMTLHTFLSGGDPSAPEGADAD